jgi:predicted amidohydrolase YtcJ
VNAIAPLATANKYGLLTGLHADAPGDSPSALDAIYSAVNRKTYKGITLGPNERIDPYLALQGFTSNAAYGYHEEGFKGTISTGKVADFVVLDQNPLTVKPENIKDIKVLETIKRGKTVYVKS